MLPISELRRTRYCNQTCQIQTCGTAEVADELQHVQKGTVQPRKARGTIQLTQPKTLNIAEQIEITTF